MPRSRGEVYDELVETIEPFEPAELEAVLFVAKRLAHGRKLYGPLNPLDGRRWHVEAAEEIADFLVYASAEEQRLEHLRKTVAFSDSTPHTVIVGPVPSREFYAET